MIYFANPSTVAERPMRDGLLGFIGTPRQGNRRPRGVTWCADNGCFSDKFDERAWWAWLVENAGDAASCRFAVAPDVVGDAVATLARSAPWLARIRTLGYPVAFVAQDGWEGIDVPWDDFDALFIGGSTDFKLGPIAAAAVREAKARGKWVHAGRVNSRKRFDYFAELGADSADGTFLTFAPRQNIHRLLSWVHAHHGRDRLAAVHMAAARCEQRLAVSRRAVAVGA